MTSLDPLTGADRHGRAMAPAEAQPLCFATMPITTPEAVVAQYGGDREHFVHLARFIFQPAAEMAGYRFVPVTRCAGWGSGRDRDDPDLLTRSAPDRSARAHGVVATALCTRRTRSPTRDAHNR